MTQRYVVTGATGHVGRVVADGLLKAGKAVRTVCRHRDAMQEFAQRGAEIAVGDLKDPAFVHKAFKDCHGAFCMIPPDMTIQVGFRDYQNRVAQNQADAVRENNIEWVCTLSSIGGDQPSGTGPIAGLYDMEHTFDHLKEVNVVHLRAAFFMENLLNSIGMIKQKGVLGSPARRDTPMSMIAAEDIGKAAVEHLIRQDFEGHVVHELLGPTEVTWEEVTHAIGRAIGKPDLQYVEFSYEDAKAGMLQMGVPEEMAGMYIEMYQGFNDGKVRPTQMRSAWNTTPTNIDQFASHGFLKGWKQS